MEIVIVSDTVRQRRSRTPISASISSDTNVVVMPDLLPKANSVPSDASVDETQSRGEFSVVEVKERETSVKMSVLELPQVDTINIFESCSRFEPEQVETVHIIDASSDTDTAASTPQPERKPMKAAGGSMDELKTELKRELEEISNFESPAEDFTVKKQRISFEEHKSLKEKDRDVLHDSEVAEEKAIKKMKLRPTLKELWMEERNSFYDDSKNNEEEVLEFSDDEEIPRYSIEMDSDSDVVADDLRFNLTF